MVKLGAGLVRSIEAYLGETEHAVKVEALQALQLEVHICVSSYYYISGLILVNMCPHIVIHMLPCTTIHVSSCYYISSVRILYI